jgi:uncharacterized protein YndB with AHSA1/START domain
MPGDYKNFNFIIVMENSNRTLITVKTTVLVPITKVWDFWTKPEHIIRWNAASDDWHTPRAENDIREGGRFISRMEARDGSMGFDFSGEYKQVIHNKSIEYLMDDGRSVAITFHSEEVGITITETFEAEHTHSVELQQAGWQAILDNFKKYSENAKKFVSLHFEISIHADTEMVYTKMLDYTHFREWTSVFNPTSHFTGTWEKGSKILFLGANPDGTQGGMVSRIRENLPHHYVSIEHLGMIQHGEEITCGNEVDAWTGALENYTYTEKDGQTLLAVDVDVTPEFVAYFQEAWPKALNSLKSICEVVGLGKVRLL